MLSNPQDVPLADPYNFLAPDGRYYLYGSGGSEPTRLMILKTGKTRGSFTPEIVKIQGVYPDYGS
jgi:hypothetical protein